MLPFEIPAVKCRNGVEVNWSLYRDTGVTDPALLLSHMFVHFKSFIAISKFKMEMQCFVFLFS